MAKTSLAPRNLERGAEKGFGASHMPLHLIGALGSGLVVALELALIEYLLLWAR